jgi:O-acetyl-ADP-ribose deacetylase (regulator of RNase III)
LTVIEIRQGDILSADVDALVNSVNCVGIMGRGIALQVRNAFPENYDAYQVACRRHEVEPGRMFVFETRQLVGIRYIINFPTKRHWRGRSRLSDIEIGLSALVDEIKKRQIRSIAVPPLGCGLGGLDWRDVRPRIVRALEAVPDVHAIVFEPTGAPGAKAMVKSARVPKMTPGRAALIGLMDRYLAGLMDPFISLLEVHKLTYFMQEAGEPLRLRYVKALYGPYAENLRQVLVSIEGHFVSGYADGGDDPERRLELVPGAVGDATAFLGDHPETNNRFARVAKLVEGFETAFGLELLSTVHWVAAHENAGTMNEVVEKVYGWSDRKRTYSRAQIQRAWEMLRDKGWL